MSTNIPVGSALARKIYSVGLFTRVQHSPGFMNRWVAGSPVPAGPDISLGSWERGTNGAISDEPFSMIG